MTRKTKKTILVAVLLVAVLGASVGYYLYNKGPMDVKNSSAIKITATELYDLFSKDSTAALKKYAGKVLLVKGLVNSVSVNQQKEKLILLKTTADGASINCTMEEDPGNISATHEVNIQGICSGIGQGDEDLGIKADVYLTRCFLIKIIN